MYLFEKQIEIKSPERCIFHNTSETQTCSDSSAFQCALIGDHCTLIDDHCTLIAHTHEFERTILTGALLVFVRTIFI